MIIGTAGHIDHGKTALVHALTGVDTDRLQEEKARGITIELGYAYQELDNGDVLGFVDVPGHERLIHTMLAGALGIDFALLVVATDDGVMPQTREHVEILTLLEIARGAVALTKIDRVDGDRVRTVAAQVRELLATTPLADAAMFPVSAMTGAGVDALRGRLHDEAVRLPARPACGHFRLAVDRSFTLKGTGTVVTGTVFAGTVDSGDELLITPAGHRVRVRGMHVQNHPATQGRAGQRCALNLAGIEKADVARGDWLVAESLHRPVERFDARLRLAQTAPATLHHWSPVHLHLGAADVMARVVLLDAERLAPGQQGLVQFVCDRPVGALHGDLFVIRDTTAQSTLGGGRVLDVTAPARRRRSPQRIETLHALEIDAPDARLQRLLAMAEWGIDVTALEATWNVADLGARLPDDVRRVASGHVLHAVAPEAWRRLEGALLDGLVDYHAQRPDEPGPDPGRARRMWLNRLPVPIFKVLVDELVQAGELRRSGAWLHLPAHSLGLTPQETDIAARLVDLLGIRPLDPPWVRDLARDVGLDDTVVRRVLLKMTAQGQLYQVVHDLFFSPDAVHRLVDVVRDLEESHGGVRAAEFRDRVGIGRKRSIQILEFFDRVGFTRRVRDVHRLRPDSGMAGITS